MASKKTKSLFTISYDAPVALSFIFISVCFLVINLILKNKLGTSILVSPTSDSGSMAFAFNNPLSYVRILLYSFGGEKTAVITNLIFIALLGPVIEDKYGSVIIGIMMFVSAVFAGVLNACFSPVGLSGAIAIIFMLIFLNSFMSFSNRKVPLSFLVVFVLFIVNQFLQESNNILVIIINIAGGLCGSLFAFLASPKAKAARKTSKDGLLNKAEEINKEEFLEELDSKSPRFRKNKKKNNDTDDDTTVVGTLKF